MVAKWIALSILIGLGVVMIPIVVVILWTISKVMFAALLIFALVYIKLSLLQLKTNGLLLAKILKILLLLRINSSS